jgi:hypothetical protein
VPASEHSRLAFAGFTLTGAPPFLPGMKDRTSTIMYQPPCLSMDLFSPVFRATFLPGLSAGPPAEAVMFFPFSSSAET